MKRFLSILLTLVMCSVLLISTPALADEEPYAVQLLLPTMQAIPAADEIKLVENAINDHIKNDLGITDIKMDLKFESLFTYTDTTGMGLASKEHYDIIYTGPLYTAVTNGYLADLTGMLDNELAPALGVLPENWIRSGQIDGKTYAVPPTRARC
jgi:ABC-type glycerol-3-phosphate transport system substrate-binding protein